MIANRTINYFVDAVDLSPRPPSATWRRHSIFATDKWRRRLNPVSGSVHRKVAVWRSSSWAARCLLLIVLFLLEPRAHADVVLFIEAPINFLGHVSSTGHAALLMDRLCSDDHIHMRLCLPGEDGSVVSRYKGIDGYDWLAMPPGPYLFAVDSVDEVPDSVSVQEVDRLRVDYRANHPGSFAHDPPAYGWVQLLGASYRRQIICIRVHTTAAQDQRLMQWLNRRPDRTHFNFFFSNCADFTRQMLDVLFPGAVHRNLLFDFGMTTPKQLESSLHRYAMRHPDLGFQVYELPQVPGNIPRSGHLYGVTESFTKSKPFLLPAAILDPIGIGSIEALGIADHRYVARKDEKVEAGFFFRPDTEGATDLIDGRAVQ